ncbi:hypothetical protein, partial [Dolichospermum sp. UHCC 0352]|uniref:hypothetical protein n=1 Tax=Dolichospermum sp. UHCC 0352 TaxID=2590011 RepID=UPI001C2C757D
RFGEGFIYTLKTFQTSSNFQLTSCWTISSVFSQSLNLARLKFISILVIAISQNFYQISVYHVNK